jgi:hypothetical protein
MGMRGAELPVRQRRAIFTASPRGGIGAMESELLALGIAWNSNEWASAVVQALLAVRRVFP